MISPGKSSIVLTDVLRVASEAQIVSHYLGIQKIPCVINSPLRQDKKPSFGLYSPNGQEINYIDFSTKEGGTLFTLLSKLWNITVDKVYERIYREFNSFKNTANVKISHCKVTSQSESSNVDMKVKVREWRDYDIEYWKSYGIDLIWLKFANVYPISHKIIVKNGQEYVFGADKYAYVYVEFKDNKTSLKVYQPYNKRGFKWASKFDKSVISLWTKIPEFGDKLVICSSLKDSLCLWSNTGIPSICPQGEGYPLSETAIKELKRRFKEIYILYDNDEAGQKDAEVLSVVTKFKLIVLPKINGQKDVSDIYKSLEDKTQFKALILNLLTS